MATTKVSKVCCGEGRDKLEMKINRISQEASNIICLGSNYTLNLCNNVPKKG